MENGYKILELWYVKVDSSSAEIGSASPFTTLKPVRIPNLGHTCYLTILVPHFGYYHARKD